MRVCKSPFPSAGTAVFCSVRKWLGRDHCCWGRSKPSCRIVGSHTRWELTTWVDLQLCLHRLLMSTGCKSSHSGFLDVSRSNGGLRISGWIGQLSCLTIFSTSLSVAAFLCRAGGWMLESTRSHGRGVERRVPETRRMVEFNCTLQFSRLQIQQWQQGIDVHGRINASRSAAEQFTKSLRFTHMCVHTYQGRISEEIFGQIWRHSWHWMSSIRVIQPVKQYTSPTKRGLLP